MKCLGLHKKPTAEVHPGHMLTGEEEEEEEEEQQQQQQQRIMKCLSVGIFNLTKSEFIVGHVVLSRETICTGQLHHHFP
jgi:hypothetical protein